MATDRWTPSICPRLLASILAGRADFAKGNRFFDLDALRQMPLVRRIGNLALTFLTKFASGHFHIEDIANGHLALPSTILGCQLLLQGVLVGGQTHADSSANEAPDSGVGA